MSDFTLVLGDCREAMRAMQAESVHTCVTSPPYFGLRDYGVDGQLGLERTPEEYIAGMVDVFREVRRVLRDDGTLWLNIGDSYGRAPEKGGSGPNGKNAAYSDTYTIAQNARAGSSDGAVGRGDRPGTRASANGIKPKDLIGIPWMLAFALRADGWYLRSDIIWHKPNPMPESVTDRPTKAHEYIFLLSKSQRYYYDADAVREPLAESTLPRLQYARTSASKWQGQDTNASDMRSTDGARANLDGRNKRSVWTITTSPFPEAHFATFPPQLIEPCILAGAPVGGTVLDPFTGSGTTGVVAIKHGRNFVGCELNPAYLEMARKRITDAPMSLFA